MRIPPIDGVGDVDGDAVWRLRGKSRFRNSPIDGAGVDGEMRSKARFGTLLLDGAVDQRDNADDEFSDTDAHGVVDGGNTAVDVVDDADFVI